MLIVSPSSTCDVCLEPYTLDENHPDGVRVPCAIECGHVFCSPCINSLPRLACPLCRTYYDPRAVRRLHVDLNPPSPESRLDDLGTDEHKEELKKRLVSMVRRGAEGVEFQALLHDTSNWLKGQSSDDHWDLRALYMLVVQYQRMYKEHQTAQMNLHTATMKHEEMVHKWREIEEDDGARIAELTVALDDAHDELSVKEQELADRDADYTRMCDELNEKIRTIEREMRMHKTRADRYDPRVANVRRSNSRPTVQDPVEEPKVPEIDTSDAVVRPLTKEDAEHDHFSPLPAHLSPFPVPASFSPLIKGISNEGEDGQYPRDRRRDVRDPEPSPDAADDFSGYTHLPASKPVSIGASAAHLMRFYDVTATEGSTSLPHPAPAAYLNKRQEKQREQGAALSRNHSSGSSSSGRTVGSKLRQTSLQTPAVPDSGDEAEINARHFRRRRLDDILADPSPMRTPSTLATSPISPDVAPATQDEAEAAYVRAHREREREHRDNREREQRDNRERDQRDNREREREQREYAPRRDRDREQPSIYVNRPEPQPAQAPVPVPAPTSRSSSPPTSQRSTVISHASTAAQAFERERERRRRESGSGRGGGTPAATEPMHGSLKDSTNSNVYVQDDNASRRGPYLERRVSSDRPAPGKPMWRAPAGTEA